MKYSRADRVASLIKEEVSQLMIRDIKDPALGFVTITKVRVSSDLKYAKVFYSVYGDDAKKTATEKALHRALSHIRGEIGHRLKLRIVPEFQFVYDHSVEYADHIARLLRQLSEEK